MFRAVLCASLGAALCAASAASSDPSMRQLRGKQLRDGRPKKEAEELERPERENEKELQRLRRLEENISVEEERLEQEAEAKAEMEEGAVDFDPVAWCTSGGGYRAMTTAIGFANAFNKADLFTSGHLTDVASNSGGSWFLTQFAYNADFFDSVRGSTPEALEAYVERLVHAYDTALSLGKKGSSGELFRRVSEALRAAGVFDTTVDEALTLAEWVLAVGWTNWEEIVDTMLAATPALRSGKHYQTTLANQRSRTGLRGPTLHFQTSETTTAYHEVRFFGVGTGTFENEFMFDENGLALAAEQGENGSRLEMPVIPVQYVVRGTEGHDGGLRQGFQVPETTAYRYEVAEVGRTEDPFTLVQDVRRASDVSHVRPAQAMPGEMPVSVVASASSAAVGMFASPLLLSQMIQNTLGKVGWEGCGALCGEAGIRDLAPGPLNDFGVCGREATSADRCPYPSRRFIDGGYVDNVATAQTVGLMQKKFGTSRALRFVLTESSQNPSSGRPDFSALASLMQSTDVRPGRLHKGGLHYNVASQQVFDTLWGGLSWNDLSSEFDGAQSLKWARASGATVDNPAFGVKAGTPVSLLLLAFGSDLGDMDDGYSKEYAMVSGSIARSSVRSVVESWMRER